MASHHGKAPASRMTPKARILDITRLVSRAGRVPTGVDRVELAYLSHLLHQPQPLYALAHTRFGYLLLDPEGARGFLDRVEGRTPWGPLDVPGRLRTRLSEGQRRAEADCRRLARAKCRPARLGAMLAENLPAWTVYLNVGHSNLTEETCAAIRTLPGAEIAVLVHDMIPLDYPELQRAGTAARFRDKMEVVSRFADLVICNSRQTEHDMVRHLRAIGRAPPSITARLGVDPVTPDRAALGRLGLPARPWFLALGTIEPRKNHALLLDIWDGFARDLPEAETPTLVIAGSRGWNNEAVFHRLDTAPVMGRTVFEFADLPDGTVAALLEGAAALLQPSLAEGFGLPPVEAAMLGTPVICGSLDIYRELLEDIPIYLDVADPYQWAITIREMAGHTAATRSTGNAAKPALTWSEHFRVVLSMV